MQVIPYDNPASLFRIYREEECDEDGYPFIWPKISERCRREADYKCLDCDTVYRAEGDQLTVHHLNRDKADCRRRHLDAYCWLCHNAEHYPINGMKDFYCRRCKGWFLGWARFRRHLEGMHKVFSRAA
jgi:hypothetical protein